MHAGSALIALALGYVVFAHAYKEKEGLKLLGQIVGVAVMVLSLLLIICGAMQCKSMNGGNSDKCAMGHKDCKMKGDADCAMSGKKMCPITGKVIEGDTKS